MKTILSILSSICKKCCIGLLIFLILYTLIVTLMLTFCFDFLIKIIHLTPGTIHHNDTNKNIFELIESRGFRYESHFIQTGNGYILQYVRIVNPFLSSSKIKAPILLHHGFQTNGQQWFINRDGFLNENGDYVELDPDNDDRLIIDNKNGTVGNTIGFVLSNRGYDVWIANYRGSFYSKNHTTLDIHSTEFWSFSMDNMIEEDLKSSIDYIRHLTNRTSIGYIGHSQGSFMMFALLSKHPEYSSYVKPYISLSPIIYLSSIDALWYHYKFIRLVEKSLRLYPHEFPMFRKYFIYINNCCENILMNRLCFLYLRFVNGQNYDESYKNRIGIYMNNMLTGASAWNAAQLLQIPLNGGEPRYFDFNDDDLNRQHYNGQTIPPIYNISNIRSKNIAFIYPPNDIFNIMTDIEKLKSNLKFELIDDYMLPDNISHIGMIWSKDVGHTINKRIIKILTKYFK
ncbi:lysosomal acid lipase/cholesteryl ester hydrolase-like [Dermatophagoides pteronyssinus]|uniref:lysosomal acid lipase/cholesteryl ester hydrolase-like n=1 Tax=Dermatophagoides pteronyssinus TaxID=6956 RepID=UPI003F678A33